MWPYAMVAQKLKDCGINVIYTSPLARSYQTAKIIADVIAVDEVIADQHLIERDFGILTGKPVADIPHYADKIIISDKVNYFLDVDGAEGFPVLYNRAQKILSEIQQRHRDDVVLIVTHGDIGKMVRGVYCGWSWERSLQTPYFDNTEILTLPEK